MGTPDHKEALENYAKTTPVQEKIFEEDISGYPDSQVMIDVDDDGYCDLSSSDVADRLNELCQWSDDDTIFALLLRPDTRCWERADAAPLGHHGHTFTVELKGTEGKYIGCFKEELEGLLGTTEIRYGRLKGCPNLTFFFEDQKCVDPSEVPVGQIPTIRGNIVVVHRDLDHLTIGIDPYSDAPSVFAMEFESEEESDENLL